MSETSNRDTLIKGLFTAGLIGIGYASGGTLPLLVSLPGVANELAKAVGGNWLSNMSERGFDSYRKRWLTDDGALNHHLSRALQQSFEDATHSLKDAWPRNSAYGTLTPFEQQQSKDALTWLAKDATNLLDKALLEETAQQSMVAVVQRATKDDPYAPFRDLIEPHVTEYCKGKPDVLKDYLLRELPPKWISYLTQVFTTDGPARTAYEQLWQQSIATALAGIVEQSGVTQTEVQEMRQALNALIEEINKENRGDLPVLNADALKQALINQGTIFDQQGQQVFGNQYNAGGDINIGNLPTPGTGSAPRPPTLIIGRDGDMQAMKQRLGIGTGGVHVLTAMRGWPGVGKTTLASALAHDAEIIQQFPDGVLWAALGQQPNIFSELTGWGRALNIPTISEARSIEEASELLAGALRTKRALLIVDDVWDAAHLEPFRVGGRGCALLTTTRLPEVARAIATPQDVYILGVLSEADALTLLRTLAPTVVAQNEVASTELVNDLECLPLALHVAGQLLHTEASLGFGVDDLLTSIREGATIIEAKAPEDRSDVATSTTPTVAALLELSTNRLDPAARDAFAYLGAFAPKPATFDVAAMQAVWQVPDPKPLIRTLEGRGLLEVVPDAGRFWMHAILVKHAESLLDDDEEE